jgi:hypothetical protein
MKKEKQHRQKYSQPPKKKEHNSKTSPKKKKKAKPASEKRTQLKDVTKKKIQSDNSPIKAVHWFFPEGFKMTRLQNDVMTGFLMTAPYTISL